MALYNSLILNEEHTGDDGSFYIGYAIVTPADRGINDIEFEINVRMLHHAATGKEIVESSLWNRDYEILGMDAWNKLVISFYPDADVPSNTTPTKKQDFSGRYNYN
jgi:hypothetical protein